MADSCVWAGFLAPGKGRTCSGRALASASSSKRKGRPRAAEVETTAEDIKFLGRFQGAPGLISGYEPRRRFGYVRFLFAYKDSALAGTDCQGGVSFQWTGVSC